MEKFTGSIDFTVEGNQIEGNLYETKNSELFFVEEGKVVVWFTETKEEFYLFDGVEIEDDFLVGIYYQDNLRIFDKKTHQVVFWDIEKGKSFCIINNNNDINDYGSLVEIFHGERGIFDKKTHQIIFWVDEIGNSFCSFEESEDHDSLVGILCEDEKWRAFDKKTYQAVSWTTRDQEKFHILENFKEGNNNDSLLEIYNKNEWRVFSKETHKEVEE